VIADCGGDVCAAGGDRQVFGEVDRGNLNEGPGRGRPLAVDLGTLGSPFGRGAGVRTRSGAA